MVMMEMMEMMVVMMMMPCEACGIANYLMKTPRVFNTAAAMTIVFIHGDVVVVVDESETSHHSVLEAIDQLSKYPSLKKIDRVSKSECLKEIDCVSE